MLAVDVFRAPKGVRSMTAYREPGTEDDGASVHTDYSQDGPPSPGPLEPRPITFRLGTRTVRAVGASSDRHHPNVLRIRIRPTLFDRAVQGFFRLASVLLPSLRTAVPEWFLPRDIVLKRKKYGWDEEFETELQTYEKLRPVQGRVVPVFYGRVDYQGAPAIVLSDVGGVCLAEPAGAVLEPEALGPLLHLAQSVLADLGVLHDDIKLDNFRLADSGDQIWIVDLERVVTDLDEEDLRFMVDSNTSRLLGYYQNNLACFASDGTVTRPLKGR
ncbi:hypothetical protein VTK73DRAFT_10140 [Phialemonium thermophilum]|uniref:Protein kinase domain-containing protein n=1 Tax=Phialemonium thermophilum TaxID=223376 RepID=A0ABR3VY99_9PEZI